MDDSPRETPATTGVADRHAKGRPPSSPRPRWSLVAAACGGSPSSTGSGGSSNAAGSTDSHQVAFSRCMRSNGVTNYPDPDSSGVIPKESSQQLGVSTPSSSRPRRLSAPAPERRQRAEPGRAAAGESAGAEVRPVHAHPRRRTPRPRQQRPHPRPCLRWDQSGFAAVRGRKPGLREVPAPLHALECRNTTPTPRPRVMSEAGRHPKARVLEYVRRRAPAARSERDLSTGDCRSRWPGRPARRAGVGARRPG